MVLDRWVPNNFPAVLASLAPADAKKKLYSEHDFQTPVALLISAVVYLAYLC
jgi:hypothetical protein